MNSLPLRGKLSITSVSGSGRIERSALGRAHLDHELGRTLADVGAEEVWVTHGREEALVHYAMTRGHRATALNLIGFDEESA